MFPDNILLWPDGFWCYRNELNPDFLRDNNYKVIVHHTDEWVSVRRSNPFLPPSSKTKT